MKSVSGFDEWLKTTLRKNKDFRRAYRVEFSALPISTQIKILRRHKGLSQTSLARRAKRPQPEIARAERPDYNITVNTLNRIAAALGAKLAIIPQEALD
ncbi:XRE family transcriptional regulator [bacterium]|nr:XRE family transcriptional regulator [bacterium]